MIKRILGAAVIFFCVQSTLFGVEPVHSNPNAKASDFTLSDLQDARVSLSSFKDKVVILFFWTTWCPYCREEMKKLESQFASLQNEGIIVLPINVGEAKSKVESFVKSRNLTFRVLLDQDSDVAESYSVLGVPTYILIDKQGMIRSERHTFPDKDIKNLM